MLPLPKTGDLSETGNYRGESLSPFAANTVNKMILNRLLMKMDGCLRPNLNGFRPGKTTTPHILGLRKLIGGGKSHNCKAMNICVDFFLKKGF